MLERGDRKGLLTPLLGAAPTRRSEQLPRLNALDRLRAAVVLTKDTVKAVSITAMEALREGAAFIGMTGPQNELIDPFEDLNAPIWESAPPEELLALAYNYCEELTIREAGNFHHSFKYLPDEQRLAMCAVYAFCRRADDIADGDWADRFPGSLGDHDPEAESYRKKLEELYAKESIIDEKAYKNKLTQLFFFRKKLSTCYNELSSTDPVFLALKDTVKQYGIDKVYFDDLISGMEEDLFINRYKTFDDLYLYCYRVASVVGLMCIEIYGYEDERAKRYAESWGIFMQLTNVLRDVGEDIERDRVYLPFEELVSNEINESELVEGKVQLNTHWEPYVKEYAKRARTYLKEARNLLPLLPKRARYSPAAMIAFYEKILARIVRQQGDVFTERIRLSKPQKLFLAATVYIKYRILPRFLSRIWDGIAKIGLMPKV